MWIPLFEAPSSLPPNHQKNLQDHPEAAGYHWGIDITVMLLGYYITSYLSL